MTYQVIWTDEYGQYCQTFETYLEAVDWARTVIVYGYKAQLHIEELN